MLPQSWQRPMAFMLLSGAELVMVSPFAA